jgi:cob(I)alamin adenosyltransferase
MVYLSRIYTKKGDKGFTSLGDGQKRSKDDLRIEAIGCVDEANSFIGLARLDSNIKDFDDKLNRIQNDLFDVGADLCLPTGDGLRIQKSQVDYLEQSIDHYNENLEPLTSFILPAGQSASMHVARTMVRRAERSVVSLSHKESINPLVIEYMNRLSDLLFVLCRHINDNGKLDVLWIPGKNR